MTLEDKAKSLYEWMVAATEVSGIPTPHSAWDVLHPAIQDIYRHVALRISEEWCDGPA